MGGDARIRWILNNGLEVARKAVKTAVKRHGGGLKDGERTLPRAVEARGPTTIMEGITTFILSRGAGAYTSTFWRKCWNITEVQDPSFGSVGDQLLRDSEDC
jgi:hypothetical protein